MNTKDLTVILASLVVVAVSLPRFGVELHWLYNGVIASDSDRHRVCDRCPEDTASRPG